VDGDRQRDAGAEQRRDEILERIRRLSKPRGARQANLAALSTELDALITDLEPLDPALADVLRQEWWRIELLRVGWTRRIPILSWRLVEIRLQRLHTIARVG
jgi:hypothetical protein